MPVLRNVDAKREKDAQIDRVVTAIGAAIALLIALRKLIQALAELAR